MGSPKKTNSRSFWLAIFLFFLFALNIIVPPAKLKNSPVSNYKLFTCIDLELKTR